MSDAQVIATHKIVEDRLATYGLRLYIPDTSDYLYITENETGWIAKCSTIQEVEIFLNGMEFEMRPV